MKMNDEISRAIQKNLPAAVAGELKEYISQAEDDKRTITAQANKIKAMDAELERTLKALDEATGKLSQHAAIDAREKSLREGENRLYVTLAEEKTRSAEQRANDILGLVGTIFRNPTVRRNVYQTNTINTQYDGQGRSIPVQGGKTITEETVEE